MNAMTDTQSILLFIRAPEKGKVKTRLAAALGDDIALSLYRSFLLDIADTLRRGPYPVTTYFHPPRSREVLADLLGPSFTYTPQEGNDLGERMKNAFVRCFSGGTEKAVLIGSDIPDLALEVVDEAFRALAIKDAVIGPASDGGYYLIGFRKNGFAPEIFEGMRWGTESVYGITRNILHDAGCSVHVLPEWHDIDTVEDLDSLFARSGHSTFGGSRTMSFIREHKEVRLKTRNVAAGRRRA